eukprot:COSAG01_NODE_2830_length_6998_cov_17.705754_11_plen_107_part_01
MPPPHRYAGYVLRAEGGNATTTAAVADSECGVPRVGCPRPGAWTFRCGGNGGSGVPIADDDDFCVPSCVMYGTMQPPEAPMQLGVTIEAAAAVRQGVLAGPVTGSVG